MKNCTVSLLILFFMLPIINHAQTYYPLPEENAYWTVLEFDYNFGEYNDVVYTVNGDTTLNNLNYKKIYRLDDYPTIYDTISTLHCFMRQNVEEKKIWFIRHYLGETQEKLGYDLSVEIGDTVCLPAFHFGEYGDSLFYLLYIDSVDMDFLGELSGYRKFYVFPPVQNSGMGIGYIEGIIDQRSTIPNLNNTNGYDPFRQSETVCLQVNGSYWFGIAGETQPPDEYCGFLAVDVERNEFVNDLIVYPNPVDELLTIRLPDMVAESGSVLVYNSTGILNKSFRTLISEKNLMLNTTNLANGFYCIIFKSKNYSCLNKFIVKH
jgi:hypothetical protein